MNDTRTATTTASPALIYSTARGERRVLGATVLLCGAGALAFWAVEAQLAWPQLALLAIGALLAGVGLALIGFRRSLRLRRDDGVREQLALFGVTLGERHWPRTMLAAVGSQVSAADTQALDVMLFRQGGGGFVLRPWVEDADAVQREIVAVAQALDLPAEDAPRPRRVRVGA